MKNKGKNWRFLFVQWDYPQQGLTGTSIPIQYAYFLDEMTGEVFRKEVRAK